MDRRTKNQKVVIALNIVSFLPSATEMVFALGLGDRLRGVTHECNYPPEARDLPNVVTGVMDPSEWDQKRIDDEVSRRIREGQTLYEVDEELLRRIEPDLILTQRLCDVCAPSGNEVSRVLDALSEPPEVLWLTPHTIDEVLDNLLQVGRAAGAEGTARSLVEDLMNERDLLEETTANFERPEVFCLEWMDPPFRAGHWVPEQVELAGGLDRLAQPGEKSSRIEWEELIEYDPEFLFVMPCGFDAGEIVDRTQELEQFNQLSDLRAIRNGNVYSVDAEAYFSRPGPRLIQGARLLGHILHPETVKWAGPEKAYRTMEPFKPSLT